MSTNELLQVSEEFLNQNLSNAKIKKPNKKGGPYSKDDKISRRNEVYRLHFEYGYSARKIAEKMNVNRNTINDDINYWYSRVIRKEEIHNPEYLIILQVKKMEAQSSRLREQLDNVEKISEKIVIERLIYDINSKIIQTYQKVAYSTFRVHDLAKDWYNDTIKKNNHPERYLSYFDLLSVSKKASQKIEEVIDQDRKRRLRS